MVDILELMAELKQEKQKNAHLNIELNAMKEAYVNVVLRSRELEAQLYELGVTV